MRDNGELQKSFDTKFVGQERERQSIDRKYFVKR